MQEVKTIPGLKELFSLKRYKNEIEKPYSKLTFYICSLKDYFVDFVNSSSEEIDESSTVPFYTDSVAEMNLQLKAIVPNNKPNAPQFR